MSLAARVTIELAEVGLLLVDPFATEPCTFDRTIDKQLQYRAIVKHDLAVLRSCNAVLMDMSLPSRNYIGCSCELTYAFIWQIPCVVYLGQSSRDRPWLIYHASAVFKTREEAVAYLTEILNSRPPATT